MSVVPIKLSKEEITLIDYLVRAGLFKSRNEAIRYMIRKGIQELLSELFISSEVDEIVEALLRAESDILVIKSEKTAEELVREERERI
ncbi:MAG: hypothetical protein DRZ80_03720 [Thermoprotei archaeon]|nr:MAG: hypothetical protein DRZ80_03720 [Thermoprotei archaeon]